MKVAVCCIGRMENRYINEFINHYLELGVDKIFIYDNNYDGEEYFEDTIPNELLNDKVEIINFRNKSYCQLESYQDCYDKHNKDYDWMLFIDIDEYLHINNFNNIKDFLKQEKFNNFNMIHINWLCYGDNNLVNYEDKPLKDRFNIPILPLDFKKNGNTFKQNEHIKSIIRCSSVDVVWKSTPHTPSNYINCCDASGNECNSVSPFKLIDYTYAYFKHYTTKTIEEWLDVKVKRGYPDGNKYFFNVHNPIECFFEENKITEEKIKFIKQKGYKTLLF